MLIKLLLHMLAQPRVHAPILSSTVLRSTPRNKSFLADVDDDVSGRRAAQIRLIAFGWRNRLTLCRRPDKNRP